MGQMNPIESLQDAQRIARAHNMFLVSKGTQFLLFRRTPSRPVFLGARADASAIRSLVSRCATTK